MPKMNVNLYVTKDYENEPPYGPKKQTQFKPNFQKAKMSKKSLTGKSGHNRCRLSHIFGLQFGLIVAKYSEICNHRFVSNNKAIDVVQ